MFAWAWQAAVDDKINHKILKELSKKPENMTCADCNHRLSGTPWCSVNLGIFICYTCSGQHRGLGVHISQVRSCNMDSFFADQMQVMKQVGNARARKVFEGRVPVHYDVPSHKGNPDAVNDWIRRKYQAREFFVEDVDPTQVDPEYIALQDMTRDERADFASGRSVGSAPPPKSKSKSKAAPRAAARRDDR